tara:strand:- start:16373 stop:17074 length:702 start_codon:yes stop_codon:yes gene_type:complete
MKTVFTKKEGVKMNSDLDFGTTIDIFNEFHYLMDTTESMWDIDFKYFYRVTDDNFIQIAYRMDEGELELSAQFKLRYKNFKENIIFIIRRLIEAHLPYKGFPVYENSTLFTKEEFDGIIQTMKAEKRAIIEQAKANQTPLIYYLKKQNLDPQPTGNSVNSWTTKCPSGGNHHLMVSPLSDEWGCGYCKGKGKIPELEKWLQNIKIKEDQQRLSEMLKELKEHGSIKSKGLTKW